MIYIINPASRKHKIVLHTLDQPSLRLPYGPAVLVSHLKKKGIKTVFKDLRQEINEGYTRNVSHDEIIKWLDESILSDSLNIYLKECLKYLPDIESVKLVGISIFSFMEHGYGMSLAKFIKQEYPQITICIGGPHITLKNIILPPYVDFLVKGYGNTPLEHIVQHIVNKKELDPSFPGLHFIKDNKPVDNGVNYESIEDEELPDFSDLDLEKYQLKYFDETAKVNKKVISVPYRISVGCINACSFCAFRLGFKKGNKSIPKVIREMNALNKLVPNVYLAFADCTISNDINYLHEFLDGLIKNNEKINWQSCANVDKMNFELLDKGAKAGWKRIYWGFEHFSKHMQQIYNKTFDTNQAETIIKYASKVGIESEIALIFNGPQESMQDVRIQKKGIKRYLRYPNIVFRNYFYKLNEDTLMYKNPGKYNIEVLSEPSPYEESIIWKPKNQSLKDFKKKHEIIEKKRQELTVLNNMAIKIRAKKIRIPIFMLFILSKLYYNLLSIKSK